MVDGFVFLLVDICLFAVVCLFHEGFCFDFVGFLVVFCVVAAGLGFFKALAILTTNDKKNLPLK